MREVAICHTINYLGCVFSEKLINLTSKCFIEIEYVSDLDAVKLACLYILENLVLGHTISKKVNEEHMLLWMI